MESNGRQYPSGSLTSLCFRYPSQHLVLSVDRLTVQRLAAPGRRHGLNCSHQRGLSIGQADQVADFILDRIVTFVETDFDRTAALNAKKD